MDTQTLIEQQAEAWVRAVKKAEEKIKAEEKEKEIEKKREEIIKKMEGKTYGSTKSLRINKRGYRDYYFPNYCVYFTEYLRIYKNGVIEVAQLTMMNPMNAGWVEVKNGISQQYIAHQRYNYVVKELYDFCFRGVKEPTKRRAKPYM